MEKIAVIGLSCLFPGSQTPDEFWQTLVDQKNTTSLATDEQMQMGVPPETFFDPEKGKTDRYYSIRGGFITDFTFDPTGYKLMPQVLNGFDNIYKWSMYVAKQALIDSGYLHDEVARSRCGIILGNLSSPTRYSQRLFHPVYRQTLELALKELLEREEFTLQGLPIPDGLSPYNMFTASLPATLAAQALGLGAGGFALDAACASPLYSVQLGCDYLLSRKADLMLAGAVSCSDPFVTHMGFSLYRAYPTDDLGRPLDQNSSGLNTGEGAGILALKRYDDAVRDGDRIYATILGVGLSNDGKGKHFLVPSSRGQVLAYERAYEQAGVDPQSVEYVECHATGTDLGDKTELNSMEMFFGKFGGSPKVGSVKANLGHLLTAAGVPSLIKVILSMVNEQIPPTINVDQPLSSPNNVIPAENVVRHLTAWGMHGGVKRAAVSAFGFGGTNAHLILERRAAYEAPAHPCQPMQLDPMAIVGMGFHFGGCEGLDQLDQTLYDGKQHFTAVPYEAWKGINEREDVLKKYGFSTGEAPKGGYIEGFDLDFLRFKIQPNRPDEPIPQQLLILKAADDAIQDAKMPEGGNVAVIIAMETDPSAHQYRSRCDTVWQLQESLGHSNLALPAAELKELEAIVRESICYGAQVNRYISFVGNIMASRISSTWDFTGPSFTVSAGENSTFKALEIAQMMLSQGQVEAVIVGAVDLAQPESVLIRQRVTPINTGVATMGFDQNANGWMVGEGAGAIVLRRPDVARQVQNRVYATIDAISLVYSKVSDPTIFPNVPQAAAIAQSCQRAFTLANVTANDVGYLEVFASGVAAEDAAEIQGLTQAYRTGEKELTCGIGSIKANIGHAYVASGIASVIKTAMCLYHRYIPAVPQWSAPKYPELWQDTPFFVCTTSRPWSLKTDADKRVAAINSLGTLDGSCAHVILSEDPAEMPRTNNYLRHLPVQLLPIAAPNEETLLDELRSLEQQLLQAQDLSKLASQCFATYQQHPNPAYVVAIVGADGEMLIKEIQRAYQGIAAAFSQGKDWQTPQGSYFAANPLGQKGGVALVYPGAFTSYLDAGRHLFHQFPLVYDDTSEFMASQEIRQLLYDCDNALCPKSLTKLTPRQLEVYDTALSQDSVMLLTAGTIAALVGTETLKTYFKLRPQAAFGYSLGEFSMMFAQQVLLDLGAPAANLSSSDLFRDRLAGPKNTIREYWGLPPSDQETEGLWQTYVLMTPIDRIREAVQAQERVYITHINTPKEAIIAGEKAACDRVVAALQCDAFPLSLSGVLHCDPVKLEFDVLKQWMTVPVNQTPSIQIYSAADYRQTVKFDSETVADRIATALCQTCDFTRLINQVYEDGARIFLELGPATTCSRWVRDTLQDREHVAIACDTRGVDNRVSTVRTLARLVSHKVSVDISPLYAPVPVMATQKKSLIRTVTMGGPRFDAGILAAGNRDRFAKACVPVQKVAPAAIEERQLVTTTAASSFSFAIPQISMTASESSFDQSSEPPVPVAASLASSGGGSDLASRMATHQSAIAHANIDFLKSRQSGLRQMAEIIQKQIAMAESLLNAQAEPHKPSYPPSVTPASPYAPITSFYSPDWIHQPRQKPDGVLFDEVDLLEMACGKLSNVFGPAYEPADALPRCTRVPMPPYLFVSRITKIEGATRGKFGECSIETEYDAPDDAWYTWGGCMPMAIAIEASHSNIFLMSYLGIDLEFQGKRVYRALGGTITCYSELPSVGQTIRCKVRNHSFIQMGEGLIFKFDHEVYVGDRLCLHMRCDAGFFSDEDLQKGQGIIRTKIEDKARSMILKQSFQPLLHCSKRSFSKEDIDILTSGNLAAVFGEAYDPKGKNPLMGTISAHMQLFDRIPVVDPQGGAWGVGLLQAEKDLDPSSWYFKCHFKDDFCMPGTMIGEGCAQLLGFYMLYLGLQTRTTNAKVRPIPGVTQTALYRGQITPSTETLTYQIEATEIGLEPRPYIKAEASVIYQGKTISIIKNMAVELYEDDNL